MDSDYRVDDLGWYQFERLVQAVLKAELGIGIEAWGKRRDSGRDAWVRQALNFPSRHISTDGPFLFQVKFVENANAAGSKPGSALLAAVRTEAASIESRSRTAPAHYVLVTNAPLNAPLREGIVASFRAKYPKSEIHTLGFSDVSAMLDNHPGLRRSYPQVLSIRDLGALIRVALNAEQLTRSEAAIAEAQEILGVFVPTSAYRHTWKILSQHHFVVLEGPPEVGKTAIAWTIAANQAVDGWEALVCQQPSDVYKLLDKGRKQVFVADDAFGRTEYDPTRGQQWEAELPRILKIVDASHWLIWTSRRHILERARRNMDLQSAAAPFPKPGDVVVDAATITTEEKAVMLYRHAKAQRLEDRAKEVVKNNATMLVRSSHFTPERIRRFVVDRLPALTTMLKRRALSTSELAGEVAEAIRDPTKQMGLTYRSLVERQKWLLLCLLETRPQTEDALYARYTTRFPNCSPKDYGDMLEELSEAFIRRLGDRRKGVDWMHPSYRDLVIDELSDNPEIQTSFLRTTNLEGIKLALSESGGERGDRRLPLLRRAESWPLLRGAIAAVAATADGEGREGLLTALSSALQRERDSAREEILTSLREAVETLSVHLSAVDRGFGLPEMRAFVAASTKLQPLPPMPDLSRTWSRLSEDLRFELDASDNVDSFATALSDWTEFVELVRASEPRFLIQVGLPQTLRATVQEISAVAEGQMKSCGSAEDESSLRSEAQALQQIAAALASLDGIASISTNALIEQLEECVAELEERAVRVSDPDDYSHIEPVPAEDQFSIDGVMSDL